MCMDLQKKRNIFIPFLWVAFYWMYPLFAQVNSPTDSMGCQIDVLSAFTDLDIWLDGLKVGQTPLLSFQLAKGNHLLRVAHPDPSDWLQRDWEKHFFLNEGEAKQFTVTYPRTYWLGSDPSGASVFIEDRWMGLTPLVVPIHPDSSHYLSLRKSGYADYRFDKNQILPSFVHVQLKKYFTGEDFQEKSPRLRKKWIVMSGIVAVISGGIGYYFKAKADRAFENYLRSSHPESMNSHYNDALNFDRYTGVFYGLAEVSLGFSLYLFIKSMDSE